MKLRIALTLYRWAASLAGGCLCGPCNAQRRLDAQMRAFGGNLPRAERRRVLRDAISSTARRMRKA